MIIKFEAKYTVEGSKRCRVKRRRYGDPAVDTLAKAWNAAIILAMTETSVDERLQSISVKVEED